MQLDGAGASTGYSGHALVMLVCVVLVASPSATALRDWCINSRDLQCIRIGVGMDVAGAGACGVVCSLGLRVCVVCVWFVTGLRACASESYDVCVCKCVCVEVDVQVSNAVTD